MSVKQKFDREAYNKYLEHDKYTYLTMMTLLNGIKAKNSQMVVGNPGLGKSAMIYSLARNYLNYDVITIIGSQKEPQDVTGFPRMVERPLQDGRKISVTEYAIPIWQYQVLNKPKTLIFLDEFSNSQPPVQAAMLQILNERQFPDGSKIPNQTAIIGAMNPVETAADGYELSPPVANRLKFIPWEPKYESWKYGLLCNWGEPNKVSSDEMYWRRRVTDFLDQNHSLVYRLPEKNTQSDPGSVYGFGKSPAENYIYKTAYPSNRSWTNLAKELPNCISKRGFINIDLAMKTANGIVGYDASTKFINFIRENASSLPSTVEVLKDPEIIPFKSLKMNELTNIIRSAFDYVKEDGTPDTARQLGYLAIAYANHDYAAYVTPIFTDILKTVRKSNDKAMVRKLMASYNEIGSIINN